MKCWGLSHFQICVKYVLAYVKKNHNKTHLKSIRKKLRTEGTSAEAELWKHISKRKLSGRKFRRQHSVGNFILDFYCPSEKLAIELDGEYHYWQEGMDKDLKKEMYLNEHSIKVLRFENKWVFLDLENVLKNISTAFKKI